MSKSQIVTVVEIDHDYCSLTFGQGACPAVLGGAVTHKCFNTYPTCAAKAAFAKTNFTMRFCEPTFQINSGQYIDALVSVGGYEQEVNIAGYASNIGGLGQRASVSIVLNDFPSRDTTSDKYWTERMSGAAQSSGVGYDPLSRGTFWGKWKARNPNYAGRSIRVRQGHIDNGNFVAERTRSYVMTEFIGPDNTGRVTIKAKDILALADNKRALTPVTSSGLMEYDIDEFQTSTNIYPVGIGNSYPLNGVATIGSEIVFFTRSGDTITMQRGMMGTDAAKHNVNDSFQLAYSIERVRADTVIRDLLINYASIPVSYIDFPEWQQEFGRWGSTMVLSATICQPTSVATLLGEISQLGITIFWDEDAQKIRVKLNRPPDDMPKTWRDENQIIAISTEDNDDERATRIEIRTVQIDPTKGLNKDNFLRGYLHVGVEEESPNMFDESRTHQILSRWLNHGDEAAINILSRRLFNRFKRAPVTYNVTVDVKDYPQLTDVIRLESFASEDETGAKKDILTQVFYRADGRLGSTVKAKLQIFQYDERYGRIAENSRPSYNASSYSQKQLGSYFVGPSLLFGDLEGPYRFV